MVTLDVPDTDGMRWSGGIGVRKGLSLKLAGSQRSIQGAWQKSMWSWLFTLGPWDFSMDGQWMCTSDVKRDGRKGVMIGEKFVEFRYKDYSRHSGAEGEGWKVSVSRMGWLSIQVEASDEATLISLACIAALYEAIWQSNG